MSNVTQPPFIPTVSLLAILAAIGCSQKVDRTMDNAGGATSGDEQDTGKVLLEVMQAPGTNTCMVLNYSNTSVSTSYHMLYASSSTVSIVIPNLPIGQMTITPKAYTVGTSPCSSAGVTSLTPTWIGPAVTVTVLPGSPTQVPIQLHPYSVNASVDFGPSVTSIALGYATSYALLSDGTIRAWGYNVSGQLGNNTTNSNANGTPVAVTMGTIFVSASALATGSGAYHMCAIKATDNSAWCWGNNGNGQLGNGNTTSQALPTLVTGGQTYSAIVAGGFSTWAINKSTGLVWAWGSNSNGQFGNGNTTSSNPPVNTSNQVEQISGAYSHLVARVGYNVTTAGYNSYGQLGNGSTSDGYYLNGSSFAQGAWPISVAAGLYHTCAVVSPNGIVQCAGSNGQGQLGDNTTTNRTTAVQVIGLTNAVAVTAGDAHTCALKSDNTVWCWGSNMNGQLGDGTSTGRLTPVQVVGITDAKTVVATSSYNCVLRQDASVWCWGANGYGNLGDGTTFPRSVPTKVPL